MDSLLNFIQTTRDAREIKRALAVRNTLAGRPRAEVAAELGCSVSFVDKWRWKYAQHGVDGLRLGHKGSLGYLTVEQKTAIRHWLQAQSTWDVRALQAHIAQTYGVRYISPKSYYAVLANARMSWKKTQDEQPEADPQRVEEKRTEIHTKTLNEAPAIALKQAMMLMVDECHLLWGDARGYAWGPMDQRLTVPISNIRERQTYYGALNLLTGGVVLWEASAGNKENTVAFLRYLRQCFQGRRLLICWDGARYHSAQLVQDYLIQLHGHDCPEPHRHMQLIQFAPYAPVQNPVEDVWLAGKRAVRHQWADLATFDDVKAVFSQTITHQQFLSEKLNWYGRDHLIQLRRERGWRWE